MIVPGQAQRVLSGMRPTGRLHLGHYHGVLKNWIELQHEYDSFFFVADWHALTTHYDQPGEMSEHVWDMVIDWLAAGIDPGRASLFIQSRVPEHAELTREIARRFNYLFGRDAGFAEKAEAAIKKMGKKAGRLYSELRQAYVERGEQAALDKAQALLEAQRNLTIGDKERLYGYLDGGGRVILPEPEALLTDAPKVPGLDGNKMSKSYKNTIALRDDPVQVEKNLRAMPTDPARKRRTDPGEPTICPVFDLHKVYSGEDVRSWVEQGCRSADIGCLDCKQPLIDSILKEQSQMHERAKQYIEDTTLVRNIIADGCERARSVAEETMAEVRHYVGTDYY